MNWRKNLYALWVGCILSSSSYTMVVPFLPLYLFDLGVTYKTVNMWSGLVFSVTFFVSALMAPYWGRRADKAGKKRMAVRAGLCLAAVYFMGAFVRNPLELFVVRFLQGVAAGFVPASMAIVASSVPEERMGFSLGLMQTATLTGSIIGPLIGGVLAHIFGMRTSFALAAGIIFMGTMAVIYFVEEPVCDTPPQAGGVMDDLRTAYRNVVLRNMLMLLLVVQMAIYILQPLITLYVAEIQGDLQGAVLTSGIVFSLAGVAGAIAAPLWGSLGQQVGYMRIIIIAFLGAGLAVGGQYFAPGIHSFGVLQFVFGLFVAGVYPAINTMVVNHTEECFRGRAFGLTMSANQMGGMIGPLLGGFASAWIGIKPIFILTGLFLTVMAGISACKDLAREKQDPQISR